MRKLFRVVDEYIHVSCLTRSLATGCLLAAGLMLAGPASAAPPTRVEVCHIPPDDPASFHTITISDKALSAHLAHGDLAGPCNELCRDLCDDGDACTVDDFLGCLGDGICPKSRDIVDCNDGLACTTDYCDSAVGCVNEPVVCSASDLCHVAACVEPDGFCLETETVCGTGETCNPATGACEPSAACPCWTAADLAIIDLGVQGCFLDDDARDGSVQGNIQDTLTCNSPGTNPDTATATFFANAGGSQCEYTRNFAGTCTPEPNVLATNLTLEELNACIDSFAAYAGATCRP